MRMAGSGGGPRGDGGGRAARGDASPPRTPAVLSGTASSPTISRELRRLRRLLWSSGRSPSVDEDSSLSSPSSCLAMLSTIDSSAVGPTLGAAACTGTVHSPPGLVARGAALARLDSPTPASSSGDAWKRIGRAARVRWTCGAHTQWLCGACAAGVAWRLCGGCVPWCARSGHGLWRHLKASQVEVACPRVSPLPRSPDRLRQWCGRGRR